MSPGEMEIITLPSRHQLDRETLRQIERLQRHCIVELETVQQFHAWLDDKRYCRQACRVIGDSRTGKTFACEGFIPNKVDRSSSFTQPNLYIFR